MVKAGLSAAFALIFGAQFVMAQQVADGLAPEMSTDVAVMTENPALRAAQAAKAAGLPVRGRGWMIAVAHPLAAEAGAQVLENGGTAADAMVSAQAVLGLVEPQSSGLGGGAFLVWYDAASGTVTTLDGRETAPSAATPRLFQVEGAPMKFFDAVVGGLSVGVPGVPGLMAAAHGRWGRSDWAELFAPAIRISEDGFTVSQRLGAMVARDSERLATHPATAAYFLPDGAAVRAGDLLRNPAYARSLRSLADEGADAFYRGAVGAEIVAAVRSAARPGLLQPADLANYRVKERTAVCMPFIGYEVCGMGPPSSGGVSVAQILGLVSGHAEEGRVPDRVLGDATRLAFADRGRYLADEDFVPVPVAGLLDPAYLARRAALLEGSRALEEVSPGMPEFDHAWLWADHEGRALPSTTHISIVDSYGNALSMTSSVENAFGSRVMAGGFLLNNQLTDFSFRSHQNGVPIANRVEPGKRPRSSMAPTIVLKDGAPVLVIGSPGGSRIIGYVAEAILAHLVDGMDVQQAVSVPHRVNRFGVFDLEAGTPAAEQAANLEALGFETSVRDLNSGLHAIAIGPDGLTGGADPRREGIALGQSPGGQ
ncbi:gamma-glutamyltransferase [Pseudooceanicola aestuarii]|uniref:gamma-glutamyltransferase n=1 Tax=Pseudooceanicola aestuarii TaxID=2697319 RepID=UPI0013D09CF4|nr:gamma-glutamyltransferase [Pseudooceanicola aestuarii]